LEKLRSVKDFPKPGLNFRDICPLLRDFKSLNIVTDAFAEALKDIDFDVFVCLEARGFIFGTAIAMKLKKGIVLLRKEGKLPGQCHKSSYEKEYGKDVTEIQKDSFNELKRAVIIDDILATGGTVAAAIDLVK